MAYGLARSGRPPRPAAALVRKVVERFVLADLPGMTTLSERMYFRYHARDLYSGSGTIVDLGSWFGSTTAALATGLYANPRPAVRSSVIHAFDQFTWEPWMDDYSSFVRFGPYAAGDSFLGEFERIVAPWRARIVPHPGDLTVQRWEDGDIELLLVDAMKSWELADQIHRTFYRALGGAGSYVIHQDFGNAYTPWIHLSTYRLRDVLVAAHDVPDSETVVFEMVGELDPVRAEAGLKRASCGEDEIESAFEHSLAITTPEKHSGIRAARVMVDVYDGNFDAARERIERLRAGDLMLSEHAAGLAGAIADISSRLGSVPG